MGTLDGKRILLIISGGIAAYKSLELIRLIKKSGGAVRCILTAGGAQFVTPLSVAALSGEACYTDLFSLKDEAEMGHIRLSREADLVVVAPASANMIARMAHGLADDLASTALLASDKPVLIAPAMNVEMWAKPAVQANVSTLRGWGIAQIGPAAGDLACGETGDGRMAEPEEILAAIVMLVAKASPNPLQRRGLQSGGPQGGEAAANASPISSLSSGEGRGEVYQPLSGLKALVTGGPTYEPLDPVRYIGNRSSGKQGRAMAAALAELGAAVTLVTGPVALADGEGFKTVHVETALDMLAACRAHLPVDIAVCTAAVSDWSPAAFSAQKI
jgi:phosphopantothenoylcysteine decarboxylase/phosphopantothenate--cysteine ligase